MPFPTAAGLIGTTNAGFSLQFQFNPGDIQRIQLKAKKTMPVIFHLLHDRLEKQLNRGVDLANNLCAELESPKRDGNWRSGDPPLHISHHSHKFDAFNGEIFSVAPHAIMIHEGFTPHWPAEGAWIGDEKLSFVMGRAVFQNATPQAPRPWLPKVAEALEADNARDVDKMANDVTVQAWS